MNDSLGSTTELPSQEVEKDPLIRRYYLQSLSRELLPDERVCLCLRVMKFGRNTVDLMYNPSTKKARYKGLIRCASIWVCPVCASQITERRKQELTRATARSPYAMVLVTYTIRHRANDPLEKVLQTLKRAYSRFKSGRAIVALKDEYEWLGSVRSLEVTVGSEGWHPHLHELVFCEHLTPYDAQLLEIDLKRGWTDIVKKIGGSATYKHGVTVVYGEKDIAEYVAKFGKMPANSRWNVEHEITKAPTKRGRKGGRTPIELLIDYGNGDRKAGYLYQEYAREFKGEHHLQWSRGLRALLGMGDETTDSSLLDTIELDASGLLLATLDADEWRLVLKHNKRGELLRVANTGDIVQIHEYIALLREDDQA